MLPDAGRIRDRTNRVAGAAQSLVRTSASSPLFPSASASASSSRRRRRRRSAALRSSARKASSAAVSRLLRLFHPISNRYSWTLSMSEVVAVEGNVGGAVVSVTPAPHNPRARRLRSLVWNDFTKERRVDGSYVAVCNHCKKQLTASSRSGTTHLKNHLAVCLSTKRVRRKKLVVRRILKQGEASTSTLADSLQFDQELSQQDLARMIVQHGFPFSIVNDVAFRRFVRNLQPQFKMVSYDTVKADCMNIYESLRLRLHEALSKLPSRVSLSVDVWRSIGGAEYLCLTCHFIEQAKDQWKLGKKILNFVHIEAPLTGEQITRTVLEKLHEWGIDKKLASVVLDNCSASDFVGSELKRSLQVKGFLLSNNDLICDIFCVRSCAHILNLTIQETLKSNQELTNWVRASLQYVKSSEERFIRFQQEAKMMGISEKPLVLDSPSNWYSIYLMLESACHYQEAFTRLRDWDAEYRGYLSGKDWDGMDWAVTKVLVEYLDALYHTMGKLTVAEKPTANLYFNEICCIQLLLQKWRTRPRPYEEVATMALQNFEQYWESSKKLMAFASILDPRYKMKSVEYYFGQIYADPYAKNGIEHIRDSFIRLYNEYAVQVADTSKNQPVLCYAGSNIISVNADYGNGTESKTFSRITLSDARRGLDQYIQETSSGQTLKSDLDMYFEEAVYRPKEGSIDDFDVLAWWKTFAAKYPVLSVMARDILGIPVSIVPPDSDARTLNTYLSTLEPVTVQFLICAQDWLRDDDDEAGGPVDGVAFVPADDTALPTTVH